MVSKTMVNQHLHWYHIVKAQSFFGLPNYYKCRGVVFGQGELTIITYTSRFTFLVNEGSLYRRRVVGLEDLVQFKALTNKGRSLSSEAPRNAEGPKKT
jgi:hypothetical protein